MTCGNCMTVALTQKTTSRIKLLSQLVAELKITRNSQGLEKALECPFYDNDSNSKVIVMKWRRGTREKLGESLLTVYSALHSLNSWWHYTVKVCSTWFWLRHPCIKHVSGTDLVNQRGKEWSWKNAFKSSHSPLTQKRDVPTFCEGCLNIYKGWGGGGRRGGNTAQS